jgi:hydrogenase maturation protease
VAPEGLLIIGYGNPLRGDDAAGPSAAERLALRGFDALAVHQLVPELAERMAAAATVIFLDADGAVAPGEVEIEPLTEAGAVRTLEHHASPAGLLRLARAGYGARPEAWLVRMGGAGFDFGEALSAAAERAVARAVAAVESREEELISSRG